MVSEIDSRLIETAVLLGVAGYQAYLNCTFGTGAPASKAYYKRVSSPCVGDLAVERSSFPLRLARDEQPETCVGTIVAIESEYIYYEMSEEDKAQCAPDELGYRETAWYIRLLVLGEDSDPVRWTNCDFISIPRSMAQGREWSGER